MQIQNETKLSKAPEYSELLGKWGLVSMICSEGKPGFNSNDLSSTVEFSDNKIVMSFVDKKKPNKTETIETKYFVLQDNLLTYYHNGATTVELRLVDKVNLVIRSPLIGISGDCDSRKALLEMTYKKL